MALIKDIYSPTFYDRLADSLQAEVSGFNKTTFLRQIFTPAFATMEWKQRLKHTTQVLHTFFPVVFPESVALLPRIINRLKADGFREGRLEFMFLPDYIETYGLHDFDNAVHALEFTTQYISCEFAVRPFLLKYGERMMQQMLQWSSHPSSSVRRLASEGSRPRLPWGLGVPALKKDPSPILPILENLKNDPSESVRRSVANNLNDISKDHPELVLHLAATWKNTTPETNAILKHACRTLLKQSHPAALSHFGLASTQLEVSGFEVLTPQVSIGSNLEFRFVVQNKADTARTIRLEYALYYRKHKGQLSKKVFKISERIYGPGEMAVIVRKQSFRTITTRTFYVGEHQVAVLVNGQETKTQTFTLVASILEFSGTE
ncbi:DNA alkylation repair protein [Adhaeribacter rhizoryzae]|uniref:DNA alkylation repair protein n=1 Tax=Adhaeribacter rhizoryzae TaxID=2607907 RepID=A0A5M6CYP5_9BACT|nr:DNA alkylation repair protein [Adhaeribacter rhizoryzae]KAA5539122.1 DNA alkylation repair protein [Adhaeribacter rhizoryzae]